MSSSKEGLWEERISYLAWILGHEDPIPGIKEVKKKEMAAKQAAQNEVIRPRLISIMGPTHNEISFAVEDDITFILFGENKVRLEVPPFEISLPKNWRELREKTWDFNNLRGPRKREIEFLGNKITLTYILEV
jgi:hypothetical protein